MKQYIKGFLSFSAGTWIRAIVSFFSTPVISYLIVPEEFGKAAMFTLVYNIALLVSLTGLDQSFVRYYYQEEKRNELFWSCVFLPFTFGISVSLIFILFESHLSLILFGKDYQGIGLIFSISLMTGIFQRFNQLSIRMQKRGVLYSILDVVNSLGNVGGTIVFALTVSKSFYAVVWGQICGNVSALVLGFITDRESRKFAKVNFKKNRRVPKVRFAASSKFSSLLAFFFDRQNFPETVLKFYRDRTLQCGFQDSLCDAAVSGRFHHILDSARL